MDRFSTHPKPVFLAIRAKIPVTPQNAGRDRFSTDCKPHHTPSAIGDWDPGEGAEASILAQVPGVVLS